MIILQKINDNLVIKSDKNTLVGTEIYVNDNLKFTVTENGLISNEMRGSDYIVSKYGNRLVMINRNKLIEKFGQFFEAGVNEDRVKWYLVSATTGEKTYLQDGYYYTNMDGEPIPLSDIYITLSLSKTDNNFYINAHMVDGGALGA